MLFMCYKKESTGLIQNLLFNSLGIPVYKKNQIKTSNPVIMTALKFLSPLK